MAMINCPECGKEISDKAKICPNCGVPLEKKFCPHCGEQIDPECVVCPKCGKQVGKLKDDRIIINKSHCMPPKGWSNAESPSLISYPVSKMEKLLNSTPMIIRFQAA